MTTKLHAIEIANTPKTTDIPVVFLHGFGGMAAGWRPLQMAISCHAPTLAFDLPGHGASVAYAGYGPPKVAAKAVLDELDEREITKAHIVGHSMGGAVAGIIALMAPERVASLTLLAPGGFGSAFNHPLLLRWAKADSAEELGEVMPHFFGDTFELPAKAIDLQLAARKTPGLVKSLCHIAEGMSQNGKQGVLPVDDVLAGDYPISVIWGTDDRVLPVEQGRAIEGKTDVHIVEGIGHSPAEEAFDLVRDVIRKRLS